MSVNGSSQTLFFSNGFTIWGVAIRVKFLEPFGLFSAGGVKKKSSRSVTSLEDGPKQISSFGVVKDLYAFNFLNYPFDLSKLFRLSNKFGLEMNVNPSNSLRFAFL